MGTMKKIITIIIIVAFAVNSAGQGYALRPESSGNNHNQYSCKSQLCRFISIFAPIEALEGEALEKYMAQILLDEIKRKRRWFKENQEDIKRKPGESIMDQIARVVYLMNHEIPYEDISIVYQTADELMVEFRNHCPVLTACKFTGLDTCFICSRLMVKTEQALASMLNARLTIERDFKNMRPHSDYCTERVFLKNGDIDDSLLSMHEKLADYAIYLTKEIHDQRIYYLVMSGRSSAVSFLLFTRAWHALYPNEVMPKIIRLHPIVKDRGEFLHYTLLATLFDQEKTRDLQTLRQLKIAYLDDYVEEGFKFRVLIHQFSDVGLPNVQFFAFTISDNAYLNFDVTTPAHKGGAIEPLINSLVNYTRGFKGDDPEVLIKMLLNESTQAGKHISRVHRLIFQNSISDKIQSTA